MGPSPMGSAVGEAGPLILVVEDDQETRRGVVRSLKAHGYGVVEAADAAEALRRWDARRPDLLIVDLGLPDVDGLVVVRRVRRDATTPILILSARDREHDKVEALEIGADDYVSKPFGMAELHARIRAVLRRAAGPATDQQGQIAAGQLVMDLARHTVRVADRPVSLTPREYELLKVLLAHAGRIVTHAHLLRSVWGTQYADEGHYVHVYVSQLRRKLAEADPDGALRTLIVSEPGIGYRVEAP